MFSFEAERTVSEKVPEKIYEKVSEKGLS